MSQLRPRRLPLLLTAILALTLGPLAAPAGADVRAAVALTSKRHPLLAHRGHRHHTKARHKTRGYRGRRPAPGAPAGESSLSQAESAGARAATIAAVLATPCQNTELMPSPANIELVRAAVLCLVNRERAQNGESPLVLNPLLEQAAEGHSHELVADNYFAHVSPSGVTPVDRIRSTGYIPSTKVGYVIGENLAWGTYALATPQAIVAAWIASPGHLANILESQYTDTGIGLTPQVPPSLADGAPGATYTQEFGVIVS
jgi:uncharacterized protein YkwD